MYQRNVLLVESNQDDVFLTERAFKRSGIANNLIAVADGAEAMDYLFAEGAYSGRDLADVPVFVLIGLNLPKINGLELKNKILADKRTSHLPVFILVSSEDDRKWVKSVDPGDHVFLSMPISFIQLATAIKKSNLHFMVLNEYLAGDSKSKPQ